MTGDLLMCCSSTRRFGRRIWRTTGLSASPWYWSGQIILSVIMQHVQDNKRIRLRQHRFMKGRSCFTYLISFYDQVTHLVDEGVAVGVIYSF